MAVPEMTRSRPTQARRASIAITLDGARGRRHPSADGPSWAASQRHARRRRRTTVQRRPRRDLLIASGGADTIDGGDDFDTFVIRGTAGNDQISANQAAANSLVFTVNGNTFYRYPGYHRRRLANGRAARMVEAGRSADLIAATWNDALGVDGVVNSCASTFSAARTSAGSPGRRGRRSRGPTLIRQSATANAGTVSIGPGNAESLELTYQDVERGRCHAARRGLRASAATAMAESSSSMLTRSNSTIAY